MRTHFSAAALTTLGLSKILSHEASNSGGVNGNSNSGRGKRPAGREVYGVHIKREQSVGVTVPHHSPQYCRTTITTNPADPPTHHFVKFLPPPTAFLHLTSEPITLLLTTTLLTTHHLTAHYSLHYSLERPLVFSRFLQILGQTLQNSECTATPCAPIPLIHHNPRPSPTLTRTYLVPHLPPLTPHTARRVPRTMHPFANLAERDSGGMLQLQGAVALFDSGHYRQC